MSTVELVSGSYIDLSLFPVSGVPVGYSVVDVLTGNPWNLAVSTATVDHTAVESVLGYPELRWLIATPLPLALAAILLCTVTTGVAAAGPVTVTGTKVGDKVVGVANLTAPADAKASFEATVTVADQIQQSSASDLSGVVFQFIVVKQS